MWRPRPPSPYRPTGRVTEAALLVLATTLQVLRSAGRREAACLWLGKHQPGEASVVHAVVVPKQVNHSQNYFIGPEAMREVAVLARPRKWTLIAAVHSHPGYSIEHSEYDDLMTPSRSALSLVFPSYGTWQAKWPNGVGVHEFIDDYWHLLPPADSERRVRFREGLASGLFDLR